MGAEIAKKFVKDSGLVDDQTAGVLEGVADGIENQAEADRDASMTDRLKMASELKPCSIINTLQFITFNILN